MVLKIPDVVCNSKIFKHSYEDGDIEYHEGGRKLPIPINQSQTKSPGTIIEDTDVGDVGWSDDNNAKTDDTNPALSGLLEGGP